MGQEAVPFEKRSAEARRILAKYPDRIPVICEKAARSDLPDIEKKKFLVPGTMLLGEFKYIIHKHINQTGTVSVAPDQTIYLFVKKSSPKTGALMSELYEQHKAADGFLYVSSVLRIHWGDNVLMVVAHTPMGRPSWWTSFSERNLRHLFELQTG